MMETLAAAAEEEEEDSATGARMALGTHRCAKDELKVVIGVTPIRTIASLVAEESGARLFCC